MSRRIFGIGMRRPISALLGALIMLPAAFYALLESWFLSDNSFRETVNALGPPHAVAYAQLRLAAAIATMVFACVYLLVLFRRKGNGTDE